MGTRVTNELRQTATNRKPGESLSAEGRLTSLDFYRGLTMFLLVGEATGLYELLRMPAFNGTLVSTIGWQLEQDASSRADPVGAATPVWLGSLLHRTRKTDV